MNPLLVVQNNLVERATAPIASAARERGISIHDLSLRDDMSGQGSLPAGAKYDPVLVYGSIAFAHRWAGADPDLRQWIFWDSAAQSALEWAVRLGPLFLNHGGRATTAAQAVAEETGERHYRPMTTDKKLPGSVLSPHALRDLCQSRVIEGDFALWSSPPMPIDAEVRVFMVVGQPVTWSLYRRSGAMAITQDHPLIAPAVAMAVHIAETWSPARHFVCDIGLVNGAWGLIEFNPIHSAGWYAADPGMFLDAYFRAESNRRAGQRAAA